MTSSSLDFTSSVVVNWDVDVDDNDDVEAVVEKLQLSLWLYISFVDGWDELSVDVNECWEVHFTHFWLP